VEPNNAIIGDNTGVELPQMQPDEDTLVDEKRMAKYSKSDEFQRIQDYFKERIAFYQKYLPDGRPIITVPSNELDDKWVLANTVIGEFEAVINMFAVANDAVEADDKQKNG
jgi:hypothetical protein